MTLTINGQAREISGAATVADLVAQLLPEMPSVLVEHNGMALRRSEWESRPVADGDRLEIIRIVAGG